MATANCGHQIFLNTSTWKTMWAFWLISNAPAVLETSETAWVWQRTEDRLSLVSTSKDGSYLSPCRTENSQWEGCLNSIWPSNVCLHAEPNQGLQIVGTTWEALHKGCIWKERSRDVTVCLWISACASHMAVHVGLGVLLFFCDACVNVNMWTGLLWVQT